MRGDADRRLWEFASLHHGAYRLEDAERCGLSGSQVARRVRQGVAVRRGRGVYLVAGSPPSPRQELQVAVWRTDGVVSHRSAARELTLLRHTVELPEVSVPWDAAHDYDGIVVHRSNDLPTSRTVLVDGIPVTNATRTLVDIGLLVPERELAAMVHDALHRRLVHLDRLIAEYFAVSRHGRNGAGPIGSLLRELDPTMGPAESRLELVLLEILEDHGLPDPVRQHPVSIDGEDFRLDVAYPEDQLFIEGDGFGVHGTRHAFEDDRRRQNLLVLAGWTPLRFTWRQLRRDPRDVADQVRRALAHLRS